MFELIFLLGECISGWRQSGVHIAQELQLEWSLWTGHVSLSGWGTFQRSSDARFRFISRLFSALIPSCQIDAIIYRQHMLQQQAMLQQPQMRQRHMRTRMQTSSVNGRSSSNSRKSDGLRELDPMTRSENYKCVRAQSADRSVCDSNGNLYRLCSYVRSSEDISSGYSSAEPMPIALNRTTSLTNTAAIKIKAKRNEVSAGTHSSFCHLFLLTFRHRLSRQVIRFHWQWYRIECA